QRLRADEQREAERGVELESAVRVARHPETPPHQEREERHQSERADESELFADDGEDEVGVRLREKEELLPPVADAEALQPARAEGDQALQRLKALAERVRLRIDEGEEAVAPIGGVEGPHA